MYNFFQNIPQGEEKNIQDFPNQPPKTEEYRGKPQPHRPPAESHTQKKAEGIAHTQISPAEIKGDIDPTHKGASYEDSIRQGGELGS